MGKFSYLVKRIFHADYSNMIKIAKNVSVKANKNFVRIFADMVFCGLRYQAGYYDYQEFEFYLLNNKQRKTFLTRGLNNQIVSKYNDKNYWYCFDDKVSFNKLFKKFMKRDCLYLDNNLDEFKKFIKDKKEIMVKPIDGDGGFKVEKIKVNIKDAEKIYNQLIENNQTLVEEVVVQHKDMASLYKNSVNTIRMFTFYKDGKGYFLQALLKIGNGGVIDNFCGGGMYAFVDDKGKVLVPAIDQDDNLFSVHPITKKEIVGFQIPLFEEAKKMVCEASLVVKEVAYVGWDVAITSDGPVLIEGNCYPGVFQIRPSMSEKKEGILPTYKKYMDI